MEMFTTLLTYGYLFIAGFILLVMLIQILAFYIAGRVTDSINDEVISAFTLLGAYMILGVASSLLNAIISLFMPNMMIPALIAFLTYILASIFVVVKIYELSVGKAILHMILSFVIILALSGASVYLGFRFLPKEGTSLNLNTNTETSENVFGTPAVETWNEDEYIAEDLIEEDEWETINTMEEVNEGEVVPEAISRPRMPGVPE